MSTKSQIKLCLPQLGAREAELVSAAIAENWVTSGGPFVSDFEKALQKKLATASELLALQSGTAAIHLALQLAGVKPGDWVICQTMSYVASANPISYLGAFPVFVDSEPETFNMCPEQLHNAIRMCMDRHKKPAAVIAVHSFGIPCKIKQLATVAAAYDIPLIEDAAEALGSYYQEQACGTFGDYGVLSFNGNKIITTGSGGVLICKNAEVAQRARHLATQAKSSQEGFEHDAIGFNYAMPGLNAAMGLAQLEQLKEKINAKQKLHGFYTEIFQSIIAVELISEPGEAVSNYWLNVIRFTETRSYTPQGLLNHLKKAGIESRYSWKPLHLQGIYKKQDYVGKDVAENLWKNSLCLPSGCGLTKDEQKRIQQALITYFSA